MPTAWVRGLSTLASFLPSTVHRVIPAATVGLKIHRWCFGPGAAPARLYRVTCSHRSNAAKALYFWQCFAPRPPLTQVHLLAVASLSSKHRLQSVVEGPTVCPDTTPLARRAARRTMLASASVPIFSSSFRRVVAACSHTRGFVRRSFLSRCGSDGHGHVRSRGRGNFCGRCRCPAPTRDVGHC